MDLKDFLGGKESKKGEYYWALVIEPGWIQAGIWEIVENKANVVSISPPAPWETDEDMIGAADTALSAAIQNLPENTNEPQKTVFGVAPSWVSGGQISEEHLVKIKKICSELSLEPSGFVILPEAIAHLAKFEEGAPANAVILGIGNETIDLAVFRLGNLAGTTSVARSVSIADDVREGLTRFGGGEPLPSRFLIYDGKEGELEEDRQTLLASDWTEKEKVKFLHTPKTEIISPDKKVLAVALAGASEIANVSTILGLKKEAPSPAPSDLGFAIGEDVAKSEKPQEEKAPVMPAALAAGRVQKVKDLSDNIVNKFKSAGDNIFKKFQSPPTLTLGLPFLAILLVASFVFWWYYPKADVIVYVSGKKIEEKATVAIDTKANSPDLSKLTLPGEVVKTTVSGDKTRSTTGTKVIGDKATGNITFYRAGDAVTLPSGTVLLSTSGLKFSLDSRVQVATGSADAPGKTVGKVTALDIGPDYNLASGSTFKVGNYPADLTAKNESAFSGGSSRQISAVSADDQKALMDDEKGELLDKARQELQSSLSSDRFLIQGSLDATPSASSFSAKVGDEASTLKLTLSLSASALSLDKQNLYALSGEVMKGKVPSGFTLRNEQLAFSFEKKGQKGSVYEFEMTIDSNLLPAISPDVIAKSIAGKYPEAAENYLSTIPGFTRAEIRLKPRFPGRLGTLPRIPKHIFISVAAER